MTFLTTLIFIGAISAAEVTTARTDATVDKIMAQLATSEAQLKANPSSANAASAVATDLSALGSYLATRGRSGDAEQALTHFTASLQLRETVLKNRPDGPAAARAVSASLNEIGSFLVRRRQPGDADKAFAHFTRSLELAEGIAKKAPTHAGAARDVCASLDRLATFLSGRGQEGDLDKAADYFTRALENTERAYKEKPESAAAARDLALCLEHFGSFIAANGDDADAITARGHFTRSLELREALLKKEPDSAVASREVSIALEKLADFLVVRSKSEETEVTLGYFTRSVELREALLKAAPTNAQAARDLSVGLNKLGDYLATLGKPEDIKKALAHFTRDLEISERLLRANPASAQAVHDVVVSHYKLAHFARSTGQTKEEELHFRACFDLLKRSLGQKMTFDPSTMRLFEGLTEHFKDK